MSNRISQSGLERTSHLEKGSKRFTKFEAVPKGVKGTKPVQNPTGLSLHLKTPRGRKKGGGMAPTPPPLGTPPAPVMPSEPSHGMQAGSSGFGITHGYKKGDDVDRDVGHECMGGPLK